MPDILKSSVVNSWQWLANCRNAAIASGHLATIADVILSRSDTAFAIFHLLLNVGHA